MSVKLPPVAAASSSKYTLEELSPPSTIVVASLNFIQFGGPESCPPPSPPSESPSPPWGPAGPRMPASARSPALPPVPATAFSGVNFPAGATGLPNEAGRLAAVDVRPSQLSVPRTNEPIAAPQSASNTDNHGATAAAAAAPVATERNEQAKFESLALGRQTEVRQKRKVSQLQL